MSMDQPKVETMKKLFGSSRLLQPSTIYLIFLYFITIRAEVGASIVIEKCCPRGQVFSSAYDNTCAYSGYHEHELYSLRSRGIFDKNLLSCVNSKFGIVSKIEENTPMKSQNSCIDLLYNATFGTSVPAVFQCHRNGSIGSQEVQGEIGEVTPHYDTKRFRTLKMCCGKNWYFDRELRECKLRRKEVNVTRFLNFLHNDFDFVTVVTQLPACKHAILDYVVNIRTDVRVRPDGAIVIDLPRNNEPRTIVLHRNTCLDPDASNPDLMTVRVCGRAQFCSKNFCARKCCPEDEVYGKQGCEKRPSHALSVYFHEFIRNVSIKSTRKSHQHPEDVGVLIGIPCKYGMHPVPESDSWHFHYAIVYYRPLRKLYWHHEYCFDMLYDDPDHAEDIYGFLCLDAPRAIDMENYRSHEYREAFYLLYAALAKQNLYLT